MFKELHNNLIDYDFNFNKSINCLDKIENLKPFKYLSENSIKILNEIIDNNKDLIKSSDRIPSFIRGIGYHSNFIRELCYNDEILKYLKKITGINLIPHYLFSNVGHINIGLPNNKEIDKWHFDSVPYVLIILLSDPKNFSGGILEYEINSKIYQVYFPNAGYAFFMKGSEIKHHVTKLNFGKRITLINSYMDKDVSLDSTNLKTFENDENFKNEYKFKDVFFKNLM